MNTESEYSAGRHAKSLTRQRLSSSFTLDIANLIVDRLFSKIPMNLRFTAQMPLAEFQQELIYEAMLKMRLRKKDVFRDLLIVGFLLLNLLLAMLFNRSKVNKLASNPSFIYSLTPEQILSKGRTEPLREFLREPRFEKLFLGKHLVVESRKIYKFLGQNNYNGLEIVFDTSLWIAKNRLTRKTILRIIREAVCKLFQIFRKGKQDEFQALRELVIDEPVWRYFIKESSQTDEINIVTTQSQFLRLPYAFYIVAKNRVVRSMLWYSTNSNAIQNRKTQTLFDPQHFRFENIDNHFVWTSEQKLSLMKYNPNAKIVVAGSILFKPRQNVEKKAQDLNRNIVIFDVTPFDKLDVEVLYNREVLTDFIEDLVSAFSSHTNTNSARIFLKPKREYGRRLRGGLSHSTQYMELIGKLHRLNSIEILKPEVDLYQLVGSAELVVGIPFTSPVVLAKELNIPSFFYVPESARDWDIAESQDGVEVINGRNQLEIFIQGLK